MSTPTSPQPTWCSSARFDRQRGLPRPDRARRQRRRVGARARAPDGALGHPGAVLPAPDAGADAGPGRSAGARRQAVRRRRLRPPRRAAQLRDDHRAAGARRRRPGQARTDARGDLHHPPRPPGQRDAREDRHEGATARSPRVDAEVVQRGGAYAGYGLVTILYAGALLHALYKLGALALSRLSRLHQPAALRRDARPRRGAGALRVRVAARRDGRAARARSVRGAARQPATEIPYRTLNDLQVNSYGLPACLDAVEKASGWHERRGKLPQRPGFKRGLGMACSHYVSGSAKPVHWSGEPHAVINLKLDFDGGITVLTGASDIGQGSTTLLTQIVAEVLLLPMARIRLISTDSALTPKDNGSYSSRVSFMVGNAALRAAEDMKRLLTEAAAAAPEGRARRRSSGPARAAASLGTDADDRLGAGRAGGAGRLGHADREGHLVDAAGNPGRQVPRRRGRLVGRFQLRRAGGRGRGRRGHRPGHGREGVGRARLRPRDQPAGRRRPGAGRHLDGHGPGAVAKKRSTTRACRCAPTCSTTASRPSSSRRRSRCS